MARLLLLLFLSPVPLQDKPSAKEIELRRSIAAGWAELAAWCRSKGLDDESRPMLDEAFALDPDHAKVKAMRAKPVEAKPTEAARKELERKREPYAKKIAALYLQLAGDGHLIRAFELDASVAGALEAAWKGALSRKDWPRARRLLEAAEKAKSDPARAKLLAEVGLREAETKPVLRQCGTHEMKYWLALPKDWSPAKKWPVVVAVEGAGCAFEATARSLLVARGDRPFLIVTPVSFSNTNALVKENYPYPPELLESVEKTGRMAFDEAGLLAVIAELKRDFGAEDKIRITGFSGGGNLCWRMIFGHPELLAAGAPACPNFSNAGPISEAPEREKLPIRVFQGDKDQYWPNRLDREWEAARALLERHGFKNFSHVLLPGVGHANCAKEVMDFFAAPGGK